MIYVTKLEADHNDAEGNDRWIVCHWKLSRPQRRSNNVRWFLSPNTKWIMTQNVMTEAFSVSKSYSYHNEETVMTYAFCH